jgi:hypothetical protein
MVMVPQMPFQLLVMSFVLLMAMFLFIIAPILVELLEPVCRALHTGLIVIFNLLKVSSEVLYCCFRVLFWHLSTMMFAVLAGAWVIASVGVPTIFLLIRVPPLFDSLFGSLLSHGWMGSTLHAFLAVSAVVLFVAVVFVSVIVLTVLPLLRYEDYFIASENYLAAKCDTSLKDIEAKCADIKGLKWSLRTQPSRSVSSSEVRAAYRLFGASKDGRCLLGCSACLKSTPPAAFLNVNNRHVNDAADNEATHSGSSNVFLGANN